MFCPKCGANNEASATACSACGEKFKADGTSVDKAKEQVKDAMNDAWATLKSLGIDPVGGLLNSYKSLGEARSVGVGVAFGIVFALCFVFIINRTPLAQFYREIAGFGGFIKLLIVGFTPFVSLSLACFAGQKVGQGKAGFSSNLFIAGVALLPLGLVSLISSILGFGNLEVTLVLATISVCITVMVLFAGLTRIGELTDKAASYIVPIMLLLSAWIAKVILTMMFG
jgi:hypothetical protein